MELKLTTFGWPNIILLLALIFSVYISFTNLTYLGLSYDESLFINASILKDETTFISKHRFGIPIMVMNYIGALKSWLYYPIFKIFGVNILSIRVPMIVLMYVNIYLIYKISIKYFNKTITYSLLIIIFTDLTFNGLHRIDHGPSAIETFLKLFSLYLISKGSSVKNSIFIAGVLLLGVFNKINFIWFVNALFGTYILSNIILFFHSYKEEKINKFIFKRQLFLNIFLYVIIFCFFVFIIKWQNIEPKIPITLDGLSEQFSFQIFNILSTLSNLRYENYLGWQSDIQFLISVFYYLIIVVLLVNLFWIFTKKTKITSSYFNLLVLTILIALQLIFTKEASNMWHVFMLYPFIQIIIIYTIWGISQYFSNKNQYFFYSLITLWVFFNIGMNANFIHKVKTECHYWLYEPTINKLINYTQNRPESSIISLDFGIHPQMLVLDKKSKKYYEFIASKDQTNFDDHLKSNPRLLIEFDNTLIVENLNPNIIHKRENFVAMRNSILKRNFRLVKIHEIQNNCNKPLYNIFKITR